MDNQLFHALQIRYIKLHFTILFTEDSILPVYKASALRGGIGEMLLRANCIRDRACDSCDFESECIVCRTMYSKFDLKPAYVTSGDSIGYVLECEKYQTHFQACGMLSLVKRRIYMLDCFEGINNNFYYDYGIPVPEIASQQKKHVKVRRHSSQKGIMFLYGITGFVQLKGIHPDTFPLLLAGELIHIEKNTSFGFGRYQII